MELTGAPFTALMTVAAVVVFGLAVWALPRLAGSWPALLARIAVLACVNLLVVASVATYLNASNGWYSSWSDLLGAAPQEQTGQQGDAAQAAAADIPGATPPAPLPTSYPALPTPGARLQKYTVTGRASGLTGQIEVYLPQGYEDEAHRDRRYPVMEAFHGFPGSPSGWTSKMNAPAQLDQAVAEGRIRESILVAPQITIPATVDSECVDDQPGRTQSRTQDDQSGKTQMETWVSKDVPQFVRDHFRVEQTRDAWAALGYSVGGYCATLMGIHHAETFGAIVSLGGYVAPDFATGSPWPSGSPWASRYDLTAQLKAKPPAVAMYIQAGRQSPFWPQIRAFLDAARPPTSVTSVVLLDSGHRWDLWQAEMPKVLTWLGSSIPGFRPNR